MLQKYCIPELQRLALTRNTGFQQGGAPCLSSNCVRQFWIKFSLSSGLEEVGWERGLHSHRLRSHWTF